MKKSFDYIDIQKFESHQFSPEKDAITVEEPLEIRLGIPAGNSVISTSVAVTMRTPGADEKLAVGFLFTEGVLKNKTEIKSIEYLLARDELAKGNLLQINLSEDVEIDLKKLKRNFYTTSSCGVCGKASIESVINNTSFHIENDIKIDSKVLTGLPEKLFEHQRDFQQTGGIHAAGLFDKNGNLESIEEDVGRHNAVDKLIGDAFLKKQLPLSGKILLVSGRLGFELVQKSAMAGIGFIAAVGAPTSLAIDLARQSNITVVGFLKKSRFNVY